MWTKYSDFRKILPDVLIQYDFLKPEEGGRETPPHQGYRSDFMYDGDDPLVDGIYMIHPEFLDENKCEIMYTDKPVPNSGFAYLWILIGEMRRTLHLHRLKVGTKGYLMEGSRKVARATVIEIVGIELNAQFDSE
jgi:hypothetical protein